MANTRTDDLALTSASLLNDGVTIRRDLRNLLSLETLKLLKPVELDVIAYKLLGLDNAQIRKNIGIRHKTLGELLQKDTVRCAIAEACFSLKSGLLTASDVATAAEAEVMTTFYRITMNEDTPIEWRYRFGSKILDHRASLLKAMPIPATLLPNAKTIEVIELETSVRQRLSERLITLDASELDASDSGTARAEIDANSTIEDALLSSPPATMAAT